MRKVAPLAGVMITCVFMLIFMFVWLSAAVNIPMFPFNMFFVLIGLFVPLLVIYSSISGVRKARKATEAEDESETQEVEEKADDGDYSGYCPYCGSPVNPDYGFCRVCGKKI